MLQIFNVVVESLHENDKTIDFSTGDSIHNPLPGRSRKAWLHYSFNLFHQGWKDKHEVLRIPAIRGVVYVNGTTRHAYSTFIHCIQAKQHNNRIRVCVWKRVKR